MHQMDVMLKPYRMDARFPFTDIRAMIPPPPPYRPFYQQGSDGFIQAEQAGHKSAGWTPLLSVGMWKPAHSDGVQQAQQSVPPQ